MAIIVSVHGFLMASYVSTLTLGSLELFGVSKVNSASGVLQLFTGVGALMTPPIVRSVY